MTTDQTNTVSAEPTQLLSQTTKEVLVSHVCDLLFGRDPHAAGLARALTWELRREGIDLTAQIKDRVINHVLGSENPDVPF